MVISIFIIENKNFAQLNYSFQIPLSSGIKTLQYKIFLEQP